jgi:hypothetical protein
MSLTSSEPIRLGAPYPKVMGMMTLSNADIETLWVEAWNDVYDFTKHREDYHCMNGSSVIEYEGMWRARCRR